jgi:hypothetical protein
MEDNLNEIQQDSNSKADIQRKNNIVLPLIALGLDLFPILVITIGSLGLNLPGVMFLFALLSPIGGFVLGISALAKGKKVIGRRGKILAIIAVALPAAFVALIIIFFIGAATGLISLM